MLKKFWITFSRPPQEEGLHIQILRYALANPGFTHADLITSLSLTTDQQVFIGTEVSNHGEFFTHIGSKGDNGGYKYMLSFEGRSRLLEYDELKEARENAHKAHVYAMLALAVSAIGVMVQIFC